MKKKIILASIAAFTTLLSVTATAQEDSVVVKESTKETTVVKDPEIKQPVVVHDTVVKEEKKTERPALRMGEFGVRYMPTFASLNLRNYNNEVIQGDFTMSQGFGIMLGTNFSKNIGLQAEVNYLDITQKYKDQNLNRQVEVSYLNIPILLSLNTDKTRMVNLNFVAGPQFGVNLGSGISTTGNENTQTLHATVGASGTDVGLAYGTGLEFALSKTHCLRLDLGYRGFYGLFDASAKQYSSNPDTYNVIVRGSRKTHAAYAGLTLCF
ncbi:MAG TPA: porin family protein [Bacteroidia bacterium]|nr:porin family protein [Bacteroidia bacterium]